MPVVSVLFSYIPVLLAGSAGIAASSSQLTASAIPSCCFQPLGIGASIVALWSSVHLLYWSVMIYVPHIHV